MNISWPTIIHRPIREGGLSVNVLFAYLSATFSISVSHPPTNALKLRNTVLVHLTSLVQIYFMYTEVPHSDLYSLIPRASFLSYVCITL